MNRIRTHALGDPSDPKARMVPLSAPIGRGKTSEAPPLWETLKRNRKDRTRNRNETVVGGAQQRR
ncbi:hypothetical protein E2C01_008068 [Portunus trituberculatus]|uniref:Uncharacterized protein n=1 Tax=Portunus trituberculatus TaxID=210409 RepID=A0A5B7CZT8_PORTR|nr:hypothetical protein [Portunus trituberculatus]